VLLQDVMPKSVEIKELEKVECNEASEKEEKLVAAGAAIPQMAMERRRRHAKSLEGGSRDDAENAPAISRSTPTKTSARRGRRRMRSEMDDDDEDIVEIIQQSEKRREDLANKQIALEERRMVDERQFRRGEAARRERQDAAQHVGPSYHPPHPPSHRSSPYLPRRTSAPDATNVPQHPQSPSRSEGTQMPLGNQYSRRHVCQRGCRGPSPPRKQRPRTLCPSPTQAPPRPSAPRAVVESEN